MSSSALIRGLGALLLLAVLAVPAAAQTVRGRVVTEDGQAAVGATVVLLDTAGTVRGGAFVDGNGAFSIAASQAGRYVLEVQRIGLRSTRSPSFTLAAGQTLAMPLTVSLEAVALPEIEAIGKGRCGKDTDPLVANVWEEARKALRAAALTNRANLYRFQIRRYFRQLSIPSLHAVRDSSVVYLSTSSGSPFASLAADTLILRGFIQEKADGTYYNAPDADVLLSNAFADAFCFNLKGDRKRNLIGLTFEPVRRNVPSSIAGTLWIDRRTSELQQLEFKYVGADVPQVARGLIGGSIHFERLPNGPWIVDDWFIRMPFYAERQTALRRSTLRQVVLTAISEEGAQVLSVSDRK